MKILMRDYNKEKKHQPVLDSSFQDGLIKT